MGWDGGQAYRPVPCANCGKPGGGIIGYSRNGMTCSKACGTRLDKKIKNGMRESGDSLFFAPFGNFICGDDDRISAMRIRIKQLAAKVKELSR
jgi:hypothetical protein